MLLRELGNFWFRNFFQEAQHDVLGRLPFRLRLEVGAQAMAQDGDGDLADVVQGDAEAAVHRGERFAAVDEKLPRPRTGAPIDEFAHKLRRARIAGPRR